MSFFFFFFISPTSDLFHSPVVIVLGKGVFSSEKAQSSRTLTMLTCRINVQTQPQTFITFVEVFCFLKAVNANLNFNVNIYD